MFKSKKTDAKTANADIFKLISESKEQYRGKIPLIFEKSNLIHAMNRVNYIKPPPFFQQKVFKKQTGKVPTYDVLADSTFKNNVECISHCNGIVSPGNIVYTNQNGFSTLVDPYVSVTTKSYTPWNSRKEQDITFWNWRSFENNNLVIQKKNNPRAILPLRKQILRSHFPSEMSSNNNTKLLLQLDHCGTLFKSVILQPTGSFDYSTEYSNYENKLNCTRMFKQRKY